MSPESVCNELSRCKVLALDSAKALCAHWRAEAGAAEAGAADDGDRFGQWLVQQGHLTDYQLGMLQRGRLDRCVLGGYILVDRIGQGRMAGVYEGRSKNGQSVAIKILPPSKVKDAEAFGRFQRESRIALKLKHPNVVRSFEVGQEDSLHYLVMEYLEGETLEEAIKRRKRIPPVEALRIVHQALQGLQHLHELDVVHRDLKPANLMLAAAKGAPEGEFTVKILDVGLGKALFDDGGAAGHQADLTATGDVLGEPDYMAPEQARNASAVDIRSDIYSLGCVLYHALTGSVPFPAKNAVEKLLKHATETPKPISAFIPDAAPALQGLIDTLMAKDPASRPATPTWGARAVKEAIPEAQRPASAPAIAAPVAPATPVLIATPIVAMPADAVPGGTAVAPSEGPRATPSVPLAPPAVVPTGAPAPAEQASDELQSGFGKREAILAVIGGASAALIGAGVWLVRSYFGDR